MKKVDFILVGQGLAGTNLAFHLLEAGKSVLVIDKFREITSSKVAAGLINPITGRRFAKTWLADELFPYSKDYYTQKEELLKSKFYHQMPVYRYLGSIEDQNTWMGRSVDEEIKPYVGNFDEIKAKGIHNEFGAVEILQGGWLDTKLFISNSRNYFIKKNIIVDEELDYYDLNIKTNTWKDVEFENIIFCEGFRSKDNPFFNWLPFTFAKGEILDIEINDISNEVVHNKNGFLLPIKDNLFKLGATFRWNEMNEEPTERSLIELKEKLQNFTNLNYKIIDQKASIRPTTKDRRPFIGSHKEYRNVMIFNGFGSKGVTLTPYLANNFVENIISNTLLIKEVDINRFYNKS